MARATERISSLGAAQAEAAQARSDAMRSQEARAVAVRQASTLAMRLDSVSAEASSLRAEAGSLRRETVQLRAERTAAVNDTLALRRELTAATQWATEAEQALLEVTGSLERSRTELSAQASVIAGERCSEAVS